MVICPCGVMGPANGAVGKRPTQIPTERKKTSDPSSSSSDSEYQFSHSLCGSSTTSDENSNTSTNTLESTVTSQPQSQECNDEASLTASSLLSKIPQLASNGTKKLTSIPVPLSRLRSEKSEDGEDKPKLEDKVSCSLVLSDKCGRYVGTKPVKSNVLSVQPVYNNPNRHLAGISNIPLTHYDSESGISIYVNPNKSLDYPTENSLNHQERSRRYLSQRSLNDREGPRTPTSTTSNSRSPSIDTGLKIQEQQCNSGRPRSEFGKRPIPQPRYTKDDNTEVTSKLRRYTIAH